MAFRPRSALAQALYDKVHNDQHLDRFDTKLWYKVANPLPEKYQSKFVQLEKPDETTMAWLDKARDLSGNVCLQIWHLVARLFLGVFMTQTDVNGMLKRGSMFILSEPHFQQVLSAGGFDIQNFGGQKVIEILDIGAGDGEVTVRVARSILRMEENLMVKVFATETSWTMRDRLQEKQFIVIDKLQDVSNIHLVSCLNVLDRCADPHKMLSDIYDILAPNGRAILALVLPYSHYVEKNTSHMPLLPLLPHWPDNSRVPFETEACVFFQQLEEMGFRVESWTKAPYLCEGDLRQSFYWLVDIIVVLSKRPRSK